MHTPQITSWQERVESVPEAQLALHGPPVADVNVLDVQELLERCMGQLDFAERILGKLCSRLDDDVDALEQALSQNDAGAVAMIAHRLKGSAANAAAHRLRNEAAEIEGLARGSRLAELPSRIGRLRDEQARLRKCAASLN
jgi:HPt (histidine-containing phosphotransfer) domain-containing protein